MARTALAAMFQSYTKQTSMQQTSGNRQRRPGPSVTAAAQNVCCEASFEMPVSVRTECMQSVCIVTSSCKLQGQPLVESLSCQPPGSPQVVLLVTFNKAAIAS